MLGALDTYDAAEPEGNDLCLFAALHEQRRQFAKEWKVTNDHEIPRRLLDSLFQWRDRILRGKVVALDHSLRYGDCAGEDLGGLPGAVLVAMPDGRELQAERPKELCDFLRIANALAGEPALGVFLFGLRLSVLDKVDAHITP
jgi:hypothetical protein